MVELALVGCGKMGSAILKGIVASPLQEQMHITIINPVAQEVDDNFRRFLKKDIDFSFVKSSQELAKNYKPDIILLAVKPQIMMPVLKDYAVFNDALFISIAAGISIDNLAKGLPQGSAIVRAMPNLGATVMSSVTALAMQGCSNDQKNYADAIFKSVGEALWFDDESHFDLMTAVCGGGPAYFYLLSEALEETLIRHNIASHDAKKMIRTLFQGSAKLINEDSSDFAILQSNVASKGGTTEQALSFLSNHNFKTLIFDAMEKARLRGEALSKEFGQ